MTLVSYAVQDGIALVTVDNGKANAYSPDVLAALNGALTQAEEAGPDTVGAGLELTAAISAAIAFAMAAAVVGVLRPARAAA